MRCIFVYCVRTLLVATNLTLDDEISAQRPNSSCLTPDATHQLRTHPAFLPADNTVSLQLISVCGWYSLGTCNPALSCSACKSIAAFLFCYSVSFWVHRIKMAIMLCCDLQADTISCFYQRTVHNTEHQFCLQQVLVQKY